MNIKVRTKREMAYTEKIYKSPVCIEHEIYFAGQYGAKGEKRQPKRKPTPEQVTKQNHKNRVNRTRRTIQLNFTEGDLFLTLCYPKGSRKDIERVKKDLTDFTRAVRRSYRAEGQELKFIYCIEIGKRGGVHAHMIINRPHNGDTRHINDIWKKYTAGHIHYEHLYECENDHFQTIAEYITKEPPDRGKASQQEKKTVCKMGSSRNLKRPHPIEKRYTRRTVRRMAELEAEGINKQSLYRTPGYIVDIRTWESGINPFTGLSYIRYTETQPKGGKSP